MDRYRLRLAGLMVALIVLVVPEKRIPGQEKAKEPPVLADRLADSRDTVTIAGQKIDYTATAGTIVLRDEEAKPTASVFFVDYNRVRVTQPPTPMGQPTPPVVVSPSDPARPLIFCFNGGPGSSSVWLHLGAFGPRKALMPDSGEQPPLPIKLVENEFSILDFADLVFVDPVTTGYSRAAPGVDPKRFHGVVEDVSAMADFIRLYLTRYKRWGSPLFVAGESYGTTRAGSLANVLHDSHGIQLNGVLLISTVLNFATIRFDDGNDLPYPLFLPSYTATAFHHKKLPGDLLMDLPKALAESEQFASTDYPLLLMKGDRLTTEEKHQLSRKLSRLTGLSEEFITRNHFRIEIHRFCKELLRDQARTVGRFDSRIKGVDADLSADRPETDPSYSAVLGAFTSAMQQYVRRDLRFDSDLKYEVLTGRVHPWDFGVRNQYLNVAPQLAAAMRKNRNLKIFVASGRFDLATPYFATDYSLRQLKLGDDATKRITVKYFEAGHMMYVHKPSHEKLRRELVAFFGIPAPPPEFPRGYFGPEPNP
jgi:carboxypeptidase C (cathepsin A)